MRINEATPGTIRQIWADWEPRFAKMKDLDDFAGVAVSDLYERFEASLVMVRAFMTVPYQSLPEPQRSFALELARSVHLEALLGPTTPVLCLLATRGCVDDWNDPRNSRGHLAIPLLSEDFVASIPMMSRLLKELGLPLTWVQDPGPMVARQTIGSEVGFFCVEDAPSAIDELGRKVIAAQKFVSDHGVASVFAVGGEMIGGAVLILIFFSRESVLPLTVRVFMPLINLLKGAMIPCCLLSTAPRLATGGDGGQGPTSSTTGDT
jgi:hypothetical protein